MFKQPKTRKMVFNWLYCEISHYLFGFKVFNIAFGFASVIKCTNWHIFHKGDQLPRVSKIELGTRIRSSSRFGTRSPISKNLFFGVRSSDSFSVVSDVELEDLLLVSIQVNLAHWKIINFTPIHT